jgi:hypothetical protein
VRGSDDGDFSAQLLDGERVIWTGAPAQGLLFRARDWLLIPFSLLWAGFVVFWESTVVSKGAPLFFWLWGIPFVLIGVFMLVGRFIADAWLRSKIRYALTNRRILIDRAGPFPKFTALYLDTLPTVQLEQHAEGRGTLRFGPETPMWGANSFASWMPTTDPVPQFLAIDDAVDVFRKIQRAIRDRPEA